MNIIYFQYIPIIITYFLVSLLFHFDIITTDTMDMSLLKEIVEAAVSSAVTSPPALATTTTTTTSDCDCKIMLLLLLLILPAVVLVVEVVTRRIDYYQGFC